MITLKISLSSQELINRSKVIEEIQNEIDNIIRNTRRTYELLDSVREVPTTRTRRILSDAIESGNRASSNAASIIEGFRRGAGLIDARGQEIASRINLKKSLYPSLEGIGKSHGYASAIGTCSQSSKARVNTRLQGLYGISEASSIDVGIAVNRTISSVKNEVAEATYKAKNKLEETLTNWRETVDVIGKAVGEAKIKVSSKIKSSIEYAAVKTQDAIESIGDAVKRKISEVLGRIKSIFQTLFKIANGIIDNIVKYGKMAIDIAVPIIINVIKNEVTRRINVVKGVFNYIWDGIKYALLGNWGGEGNLLGIVLRMALEALCWISLVTPFAPIGIIGLALFTIEDLSYDIVHFEGKPMDYVSIGLDLLGALPLIGAGLKKTKYGAKFLRYLKGPIDDIMSTKTVKWINKVADGLKGKILNSKIVSRVGKTLDAIKLRILNTKLVKKVARFRDAVLTVIDNDISVYRRAGITPQKPEGTFVGRVKKEFDELGKEIDGKDLEKVVEGTAEGVNDIRRIKEIEVKFNYKTKYDETEFARQLADQEAGMNKLTVDEYLKNRERYIAEGRAIEGNAMQQAVRKEALANKIDELIDNGMSFRDAEIEAEKWIEAQAALHNPDQIAGGNPLNIDGMGDKRINSSIGSQWKYRIDVIDEQIRALAEKMTELEKRSTYLNIKLKY